LVDKFVEHLSAVCRILKGFANPKGQILDLEYDIRHIMDLLDLDGWQQHPALKFYFSPMQAAFDELVDELREMHRKGSLRVSYFVERNVAMTEKIYDLVRNY